MQKAKGPNGLSGDRDGINAEYSRKTAFRTLKTATRINNRVVCYQKRRFLSPNRHSIAENTLILQPFSPEDVRFGASSLAERVSSP